MPFPLIKCDAEKQKLTILLYTDNLTIIRVSISNNKEIKITE